MLCAVLGHSVPCQEWDGQLFVNSLAEIAITIPLHLWVQVLLLENECLIFSHWQRHNNCYYLLYLILVLNVIHMVLFNQLTIHLCKKQSFSPELI